MGESALMAVKELARLYSTSVPIPIKAAEVTFDELGYPGWRATVWTNPPSSIYDEVVALADNWWAAFGKIVLDWNFADKNNVPIPRPSMVESEHDLDLPYGPISYLFGQFINEVRTGATVPKGHAADSSSISSTNGVSQGIA